MPLASQALKERRLGRLDRFPAMAISGFDYSGTADHPAQVPGRFTLRALFAARRRQLPDDPRGQSEPQSPDGSALSEAGRGSTCARIYSRETLRAGRPDLESAGSCPRACRSRQNSIGYTSSQRTPSPDAATRRRRLTAGQFTLQRAWLIISCA